MTCTCISGTNWIATQQPRRAEKGHEIDFTAATVAGIPGGWHRIISAPLANGAVFFRVRSQPRRRERRDEPQPKHGAFTYYARR
jgi:hypothetical protein